MMRSLALRWTFAILIGTAWNAIEPIILGPWSVRCSDRDLRCSDRDRSGAPRGRDQEENRARIFLMTDPGVPHW